MPQVFIIVSPQVSGFISDGELTTLGKRLVTVVEEQFGIADKKDVSFTCIRAVAERGEANIQVDVRYTAGTDEYGWGMEFDPDREVLEKLADAIGATFGLFLNEMGLSPLSLSVWPQPVYNSVFKTYK